jgi:MEMO1 family protein
VRPAAVAGLFYPDDAQELRETVSGFLRQTAVAAPAQTKALIVPHAGYIYSGLIAAAAYSRVAAQRSNIRRVVLIGPSHRVYLRGMAVPEADVFATPLGHVPIDREAKSFLAQRADVVTADAPHAMEHCLEVQLPFLQMLFENFTVLPVVLGEATPQQVGSLLQDVWGGEETLVLASSDLSHYHDYPTAREIDANTSSSILSYDTTLSGEQACGAVAINGLLHLARQRHLSVSEIARCNSGDTAGDKRRVVGYGAFAFDEDRRES